MRGWPKEWAWANTSGILAKMGWIEYPVYRFGLECQQAALFS